MSLIKKIATYSALDKAKCIIEFDQNGNIIAANSNFLNAMGYKIGEIKGKHHSIFLDPDYANSDMYKNFWQQLKEGKSQNADFKRYGKNSKEVCLQASYLPIKNIFGKTSRIIKYADLAGQIEAINKSQAVIEFDTDGTIITANSIFLDLMGYTIHEIQGKHHSIFVEKNYSLSEEYKNFWNKLLNGEFQQSEFKRIGKGDKEVWIQAWYNPIFDLNGKICKIVKYANNITDQKIKNADFSGQIKAIHKSKAVIEFDLNGNILFANDKFLDVMGYRLDEIKGKHHSIFLENSYKASNEYKTFWRNLVTGNYQQGEFKRLGKEGKEIWIQACYNPIFDQNGKVFKVVKYANDVTNQKMINLDSSAKLEAINKSQAVIEFNINGIITYANKNFLDVMGYDLEEIKGKHHSMFVEDSFALSEEYSIFWSNLRKGTFQQAEYKRLGKNGKEVWIQACYNPIYDLNGNVIKIVKYASDITAKKILEQNAEENNKQLMEALSVGEMLETIDNIAYKTHIVALNASVEAAIAGEKGKGFAVVAAEVKNLASQTKISTNQIIDKLSLLKKMAASMMNSNN